MSDTFPDPRSPHGWPELRQLWTRIQERRATERPPGKALEYLVLRAFELDGAFVRSAYVVRLDGEPLEELDGAIYVGSMRCIVECKDRRDPLGVEALAKLRNQLLRRPAGMLGVLFSTSGYRESAITLARFSGQQPIVLWYPQEITRMLELENPCAMLNLKYRFCVEEGKPEANTMDRAP